MSDDPDLLPPPPARRRDRAADLALVAAGGATGTAMRWGLSAAVPVTALPWATLLANLSGALAIGLLVAAVPGTTPAQRRWRLVLGTGLLGGYTTMSALAVETDRLVADDRELLATAYLVVTVVLGLVLAGAGRRLGPRVAAARAR